jgi:exoribonuclease R
MKQSNIAGRDKLKVIAQRAMIQRGFLPNFSSAVLAETDAIVTAAAETDPSIRDLRDFLCCSIDNDDSLDLDQLTAFEPMAGRKCPVK